MSSKINRPNIEDILKRVGGKIGSGVQKEIAQALGVKKAVLTNWKKRGTIPWNELYNFAIENKMSLDLLIIGEANHSVVPMEMLHRYSDNEKTQQVLEEFGRVLRGEDKDAVDAVLHGLRRDIRMEKLLKAVEDLIKSREPITDPGKNGVEPEPEK